MSRVLLVLLLAGAAAGTLSAQAQSAGSPIQQRRDSLFTALRRAGVDTFCVYRSGCRGYHFQQQTPCEAEERTESAYLFWRQQQRTYRLYLGDCRLRPAVEVKSKLWTYFDQHHQAVRTDTIHPFHIRSSPKPKRVRRSHDCWNEFQLYLPADTLCRSVEGFNVSRYVENLGGRRRARNMYYRTNRRSRVYRFLQLLAAAAQAPPRRHD